MTRDEIEARFPNILDHLQASFILARGEARAAVQCYVQGYGYGCEAVMHAGGPGKVLSHISHDFTREHNRKVWLS